MGTRCTINFNEREKEGWRPVATVYRHWDGSPKNVKEDLATFFDDVKKQCGRDTRFNDPSCLAAKFVVWQAAKYVRDPEKPLLFLGLGILTAGGTQSDLKWVYDIACGEEGEIPKVAERPYS